MQMVCIGLALNAAITYYVFLAASAPYDKVPDAISWIMILLLVVAVVGAILLNSSKRLLGINLVMIGALGCFPVGLIAIYGAWKLKKLHYKKLYRFL